MTTEMVSRATGEIVEMGALSAQQIRNQVNLIQEVMREVMQDGQHYGKVPGCGEKPTLLKPGAEKLSMVFRLRPIIKEQGEDVKVMHLENGHRDYTVYCHVFNMAGIEMSTGVGSCSTMESKYRYRGGQKTPTDRQVPKEYWNLKKAGKTREAQDLIGGPGYSAGKVNGVWMVCEVGEKMDNPDIADVYNTVLKMAKKRAYVDGILSATGASDIFTQDIEDMGAAAVGNGTQASDPVTEEPPVNAKPPTEKPKAKTPAPAAVPVASMTIADALQASVGTVIGTLSGFVTEIKPRKFASGKQKTDYTIADEENTVSIIVSEWREPIAGIAAGTPIEAVNVKVTDYNGSNQYTAEKISGTEPGIPF
jgi:hypothetical protein